MRYNFFSIINPGKIILKKCIHQLRKYTINLKSKIAQLWNWDSFSLNIQKQNKKYICKIILKKTFGAEMMVRVNWWGPRKLADFV